MEMGIPWQLCLIIGPLLPSFSRFSIISQAVENPVNAILRYENYLKCSIPKKV